VDLEEVFGNYANTTCASTLKYTFGVGGDKFLGFMITHRGIEANPNKCTAIWRYATQPTYKKSRS